MRRHFGCDWMQHKNESSCEPEGYQPTPCGETLNAEEMQFYSADLMYLFVFLEHPCAN